MTTTPVLLLLSFAAVAVGWLALAPLVSQWMSNRAAEAEVFRRQLHLEKPPAFSIYGAPLVAAVLFVLLTIVGAWFAGVVLGFIVFKFLDAMPRQAVKKRAVKFDGQLADALVGLSNSLRAGLSLPQAVKQVATGFSGPIAQEFADAFREYELGKPIEQAFEDVRERIDSRNYGLAVSAFRVGKERGGNLAEVFEKIATSIREIWRLEEHVKTITTQGRSSARFMTMMPAVFLVLLYVMDSDSMMLLFTDPLGIGILTVVLLINVIGHLWIRRILAVDV